MPASLSDRVNQLFDVMHAVHQPAAANHDVAQTVALESRTAFSGDDLQQLRAGTRDATAPQLEAIARYFGVPGSFLANPDGNAHVAAQLRLLKAMRDQGVHTVQCAGRLTGPPGDANSISALAQVVAGLGTDHSSSTLEPGPG
jgi:hypothetical protein